GVRAVITDIPEPIAKADVVLDHDACRDGVVIAGADAVRAAVVVGVIVYQRVGRPAVADNPVKACVNHIVVCLIAVADKEAQAGLAAGYAAVVDEAVSDDVGAGISAVDTALFMNLDAEAVDVIERVAVNEVVRALDVHPVLQLGAADVVNRAPHNLAVADDAACVLQFNALGIMHVLDFAAPEPNMVRRARAGRGDVDTGGTQVGPVEDQVVELDISGVSPPDADGKILAEGRLDGHRLAGVSGDGHATGPGDAAGDDVDQRLGVGTAPDVQCVAGEENTHTVVDGQEGRGEGPQVRVRSRRRDIVEGTNRLDQHRGPAGTVVGTMDVGRPDRVAARIQGGAAERGLAGGKRHGGQNGGA